MKGHSYVTCVVQMCYKVFPEINKTFLKGAMWRGGERSGWANFSSLLIYHVTCVNVTKVQCNTLLAKLKC